MTTVSSELESVSFDLDGFGKMLTRFVLDGIHPAVGQGVPSAPQPQFEQAQCYGEVRLIVRLQGVIVVSLGEVEILIQTNAILMHPTQVIQRLC